MTAERFREIIEFFADRPICEERDAYGVLHLGEECHCECAANGIALIGEVEVFGTMAYLDAFYDAWMGLVRAGEPKSVLDHAEREKWRFREAMRIAREKVAKASEQPPDSSAEVS